MHLSAVCEYVVVVKMCVDHESVCVFVCVRI